MIVIPSENASPARTEGSRPVSFELAQRDPFGGAGFQPVGQAGVSPAVVSTGVTPVCPAAEDGCAMLLRMVMNLYACTS